MGVGHAPQRLRAGAGRRGVGQQPELEAADPEAYLAKLKIKNIDGKKGMGSKK